MPAPRQLVVEADGGSRGNPGPAGYGAVVIDPDTAQVLAEAAEFIGVASNNVAEYRGLIAGLTAVRDLFPDTDVRVLVRMDSKLVVEQMSGRWKIKHPDMKPLAARAAEILPASSVTYEWIPRAENKHADRLANEAMDAGRRGGQWEPSSSTAGLDTPRAAPEPEPSGPPGDAAAGAAKVRAAMAAARPAPTRAPESPQAARAGQAPDVPQAAQAPQVGWGSAPDLGSPATFVLLRHGETVLTPEKRFSGSGGGDPELSAIGRDQAARAADAFAARGTVQEIVSSPLRRCRETAAAVADRLGLEVRIEEGLRETDFGAWEGLTFAEVRERFGSDLSAWLASPEAAPTGGGESFTEVAERVAATRDRLIAAYAGRTVLLVTHVTPIKTLVRLALGAPPESLFRMELSPASLSVVAYYADGNPSLRLLNDTSHLG
ncbi:MULTISPECIES: bifunctional RNase H/acid phosphatase [Streptomyces]|uniref:bifunctional RNase H/acid phosphatase n=1 Tax=Streptomyces TaxID=1883 RepID=UPI00081B3152|nr:MULTISPECIES: bifunctional RNase H/acid phosphatase [unclassified Streptomyces]MYQ52996.1 bifunctional RNase H/acid phosphatase [Streptomyces sp. SID4941]SCD95343.1 probable phosphoglycerate mutase [Streptomyces sp. PalvLS-984]SDD61338.1 probable phosphoglycerate mutase [Streptomyces sp. AmelKG-A3]